MPKRVIAMQRQPETLDIVSRGRRGPPEAAFRLSPAQIENVARTVRHVPEVMVKVTGGARDTGGAKAHFNYIGRQGRLEIEMDDGTIINGKRVGARIVDDWNLDLSRGQYRPPPAAGEKDNRPKVVHNIILSMPPPTPPQAVLAAARKFAREHFALQHRYALVLHTDQKHPHVHLVVKAENEFEPERRLHITKPMLQQWREDFARYLREQGVSANATSAALRGRPKTTRRDPIYRRLKALAAFDALSPYEQARTHRPIPSTFMQSKVRGVAEELRAGRFSPEQGKSTLLRTRADVEHGWRTVAEALRAQGQPELAQEVEQFLRTMPAPRTDRERIAAGLWAQLRGRQRDDDGPQAQRE